MERKGEKRERQEDRNGGAIKLAFTFRRLQVFLTLVGQSVPDPGRD